MDKNEIKAANRQEVLDQLSNLKRELLSGAYRWFCTILFIASVLLLVLLETLGEKVEVFVPVRMGGRLLFWVVLLSMVFWGSLAAQGWLASLRGKRKIGIEKNE